MLDNSWFLKCRFWEHKNGNKPWVVTPYATRELPKPTDVSVYLAEGVSLEWTSIHEQSLAVERYCSSMGFCLDQEDCSVIPDDKVINVAVLEFDVVHDDEMIHRQPLQNPLHLTLCLGRPRILADIKPPRLFDLHARRSLPALKYFAVEKRTAGTTLHHQNQVDGAAQNVRLTT